MSSVEDPSEGSNLVHLFVYGRLLRGERDHALIATGRLVATVHTLPIYTLVDLVLYPALLIGGGVAVVGELYEIDKKTRFALDVKMECPVLFYRTKIKLHDGGEAETYAMQDEKVRGRRRLKRGSWRDRFLPRPLTAPGPMSEFARKRWER